MRNLKLGICLLWLFGLIIVAQAKLSKRPREKPSKEKKSAWFRRPEDNGEFEIYYTKPGGKRLGCRGLFAVDGKEEVANLFVDDPYRGKRQNINTANLSSALTVGIFDFTSLVETIRRYAFLPMICLVPLLRPVAGILGMNLDVDLIDVDNMLNFNLTVNTGISIEASASFACPPGPQGPPGRSGFAGPRGIRGPPGPEGLHGKRGKSGPKGEPGQPGLPGLPGPDGYPGDEGETGVAGPEGPRGVNGRDGRDGLPGIDGSQGATGADGQDGLNGQDGSNGRIGPQGPSGDQGWQGIPGMPGFPGLPSPNGVPGAPGLNGRPGLPGLSALPAENAQCPAQPQLLLGWSQQPQSECSFVELNRKPMTKASVTLGGGGGGGGGDFASGPGGSGGDVHGVGIADAGSTALGFYVCNSKDINFIISVDNSSELINVVTDEDESVETRATPSVERLKVRLDADGDMSITPLDNIEERWTFTRHWGVNPTSGYFVL